MHKEKVFAHSYRLNLFFVTGLEMQVRRYACLSALQTFVVSCQSLLDLALIFVHINVDHFCLSTAACSAYTTASFPKLPQFERALFIE